VSAFSSSAFNAPTGRYDFLLAPDISRSSAFQMLQPRWYRSAIAHAIMPRFEEFVTVRSTEMI